MAAPRFLSTSNSAVGATSFTTASVTPTNGRVLTAWCATVIVAGTPNTPTATGTNGFSGTWTEIANVVQDQIKITLFRSVAASGVAGTITFDLAGQTNLGAAMGIEEWVDVATTLNVQSGTSAADGATSVTLSPALSAFASTLNGTYAVVADAGNLVAVRGTNSQGFMSQLASAVTTNAVVGGGAFYSPTSVTAPVLSCSGAGSDLVLIAMEVSNSITSGFAGPLVGGGVLIP